MARPNITTADGRNRLRPRREPYFNKIAKCQYLGFRRLDSGGTWVARITIDGAKKVYNTLGSIADIPEFDGALQAALAWFRTAATDGPKVDARYTVKTCLEDYIEDVRDRCGEMAAYRTENSTKAHIIKTEGGLGGLEVAKLTKVRIEKWLKSLVAESDDPEVVRRSKDTANRILTILKAALNRAFNEGIVREDREWRRVKAFKDVGRSRDVFLTRPQCTALLDACEPDFRDLVRSGLLTGARYGELADATVGNFDARNGTLRIVDGKTGSRDIVLSDDGIAHFRRLAKGKLPAAFLHTRADGVRWDASHQIRRMKDAVIAANKKIRKPGDRLPMQTCFYSLRHTHASVVLAAGVNYQVVAENLGTSIRMLEKHYGKFLHSKRREMFNAVKLA